MNPIDNIMALGQGEAVGFFNWLPEGTTHIKQCRVIVQSGGRLEMSTHAFRYDDNGVLMVYVTDNDNEYPRWARAEGIFYDLDFPRVPINTAPPAAPQGEVK